MRIVTPLMVAVAVLVQPSAGRVLWLNQRCCCCGLPPSTTPAPLPSPSTVSDPVSAGLQVCINIAPMKGCYCPEVVCPDVA